MVSKLQKLIDTKDDERSWNNDGQSIFVMDAVNPHQLAWNLIMTSMDLCPTCKAKIDAVMSNKDDIEIATAKVRGVLNAQDR